MHDGDTTIKTKHTITVVQQWQLMRQPGIMFNTNTVQIQWEDNLNLGTCGPTQCAKGKPQQIDSWGEKPIDNLASKLCNTYTQLVKSVCI